MNIADHQARCVAESASYNPSAPPRVLGAIFGIQLNNRVEVMSSLEAPYSFDEEKQIRIDDDTFAEDTDLYKQIYPEHECLGWYSTAEGILDTDMTFHKRFHEYNESPLYLRMNAIISSTDKSLPVTLYRSELRQVNNSNQTIFISLPFKVVSDPSERLTTDHIIQNKDVPYKGSVIVPQYDTLINALKSLRVRLKVLVDYLGNNNNKNKDLEVLRKIESVTNRLPLMTNEKFNEDFFNEMCNGMIMTYLSSMIKSAQKVSSMLDLYEKVMENNSNSGMGGGGLQRHHGRFKGGGIRRFYRD